MECLRNYVGVLGCGAKVPSAGRYINSLPGISLERIEKLADDEQKNFLGVWDDIQSRGLDKFSIEVTERFAKYYKLKQIRSTTDLLKKIDASGTIAPSAVNRGFSIELTVANTIFVASNLQLIYVESLSFYVIDKTTIGPSVIIQFTDLETLKVIQTITVLAADIEDGWNDIEVNKYYDVDRMSVTYNAASFTGVTQLLNTLAVNGFYSQVDAVYGGYVNPFIRGVEFALADQPSFDSNTFGLTAVFSIACKFDKLICSNKSAFVYPLMYLLGSELMLETLSSSRTNYMTTIGKEDAAGLYKDFYAEFDRSINQVLESINLDSSDECLECNARFRMGTMLP